MNIYMTILSDSNSEGSVTSPIYRPTVVPNDISHETESVEQNDVAITPANPDVLTSPEHIPSPPQIFNSYTPAFIPSSGNPYMENPQFLPANDLPQINHHATPSLFPDHLLDLFTYTYPYIVHTRDPIPEEDIPNPSRLRTSDTTHPLSPSLPYPPGFSPPASIHENGESARADSISTISPSTVVTRLERHEDQLDALIYTMDHSELDRTGTISDTLHGLTSSWVELQRDLTRMRSDVSETRSFAIALRREGQDCAWRAEIAQRRADTLENLVADMQIQHHTEIQSLRAQMAEMGEHMDRPDH